MNIWLKGFLIGLAGGTFLFVVDYLLLKSVVSRRAKSVGKKPEFDQNERRHVITMARFCAMLPLAGAVAAWWLFG
ncbi:MAG TPA: hypothetical protein VMI15_03555 [Burkholderiales bacterium]|nr:hypothetical protein [Burkholderiales bacterium]